MAAPRECNAPGVMLRPRAYRFLSATCGCIRYSVHSAAQPQDGGRSVPVGCGAWTRGGPGPREVRDSETRRGSKFRGNVPLCRINRHKGWKLLGRNLCQFAWGPKPLPPAPLASPCTDPAQCDRYDCTSKGTPRLCPSEPSAPLSLSKPLTAPRPL